jgi:putative acetyltransferase
MKKQKRVVDVRPEVEDDLHVIHAINTAAFKTEGEAKVVDELRENCSPFISLVAEVNDKAVGHILFTPVELHTDDGRILEGMGLAPLAVLPEYQHKGIGSALCEAGLAEMRNLDIPFVVVLGHPRYYPRFGFKPAADIGLRCVYPDVPPEAFMIKVFDKTVLRGIKGVIHYQPEFDEVT